MKNWLLAIRPKTLFASVGPVILGLAIAYFQEGHINTRIGVVTLICALLLQVASNLANDYLDFANGIDTDQRLGPTRVTSSGLISSKAMKRALAITLMTAFLFGIYLMTIGGPVIMTFGLLSLYFAYGYTGGPYPLSTNGLGEVAAFIFFGLIAVTGTTYLQTGSFTSLGLLLGMGPGFISACILAINNLRDIKSDEETSKRTLAVRFGEKFQRGFCIWNVVMADLVILFVGVFYQLKWILPVILISFFYSGTWLHILKKPIDSKLNTALAKTAQFNLFYCLMLSAGLIISRRFF